MFCFFCFCSVCFCLFLVLRQVSLYSALFWQKFQSLMHKNKINKIFQLFLIVWCVYVVAEARRGHRVSCSLTLPFLLAVGSPFNMEFTVLLTGLPWPLASTCLPPRAGVTAVCEHAQVFRGNLEVPPQQVFPPLGPFSNPWL